MSRLNGYEQGWLNTFECVKFNPTTKDNKYASWDAVFQHKDGAPYKGTNGMQTRWIWVARLARAANGILRDEMIHNGGIVYFPNYGLELSMATIKSFTRKGNFCYLTLPDNYRTRFIRRKIVGRFKKLDQKPCWLLSQTMWRALDRKRSYRLIADADYKKFLNET